MTDERDFLMHLLRIAADDDELNPDDLEFAVITGGTTRGIVTRHRSLPEIVDLGEVSYYPFEKGEVIVLPKESYREPFGQGRSTAKCDVSEERFGRDWAAAKRRSDEVQAAPGRDAFRPSS